MDISNHAAPLYNCCPFPPHLMLGHNTILNTLSKPVSTPRFLQNRDRQIKHVTNIAEYLYYVPQTKEMLKRDIKEMHKYDRIIRSLCMIYSWMSCNIDICTSAATEILTTRSSGLLPQAGQTPITCSNLLNNNVGHVSITIRRTLFTSCRVLVNKGSKSHIYNCLDPVSFSLSYNKVMPGPFHRLVT
jgi:hypothetical protein